MPKPKRLKHRELLKRLKKYGIIEKVERAREANVCYIKKKPGLIIH